MYTLTLPNDASVTTETPTTPFNTVPSISRGTRVVTTCDVLAAGLSHASTRSVESTTTEPYRSDITNPTPNVPPVDSVSDGPSTSVAFTGGLAITVPYPSADVLAEPHREDNVSTVENEALLHTNMHPPPIPARELPVIPLNESTENTPPQDRNVPPYSAPESANVVFARDTAGPTSSTTGSRDDEIGATWTSDAEDTARAPPIPPVDPDTTVSVRVAVVPEFPTTAIAPPPPPALEPAMTVASTFSVPPSAET